MKAKRILATIAALLTLCTIPVVASVSHASKASAAPLYCNTGYVRDLSSGQGSNDFLTVAAYGIIVLTDSAHADMFTECTYAPYGLQTLQTGDSHYGTGSIWVNPLFVQTSSGNCAPNLFYSGCRILDANNASPTYFLDYTASYPGFGSNCQINDWEPSGTSAFNYGQLSWSNTGLFSSSTFVELVIATSNNVYDGPLHVCP